MELYACFIDGQFLEVRYRTGKPADVPKKKAVWVPVGEKVEGDKPGWKIVKGLAVETILKKPRQQKHTIRKTTIWIRMTDVEAASAQAKLEEMKVGAPRLYRLFADSFDIDHNETEFFPELQKVFTSLYRADRATELLEPDR